MPRKEAVAVCLECWNSGDEFTWLPKEEAGDRVPCDCERLDGSTRRLILRSIWYCDVEDCEDYKSYDFDQVGYKEKEYALHDGHYSSED